MEASSSHTPSVRLLLEWRIVQFLHQQPRARWLTRAEEDDKEAAWAEIFDKMAIWVGNVDPAADKVDAAGLKKTHEKMLERYCVHLDKYVGKWQSKTLAEWKQQLERTRQRDELEVCEEGIVVTTAEEAIAAFGKAVGVCGWLEAMHEVQVRRWTALPCMKTSDMVAYLEDAKADNTRKRKARYREKQKRQANAPEHLSDVASMRGIISDWTTLHSTHPNRIEGLRFLEKALGRVVEWKAENPEQRFRHLPHYPGADQEASSMDTFWAILQAAKDGEKEGIAGLDLHLDPVMNDEVGEWTLGDLVALWNSLEPPSGRIDDHLFPWPGMPSMMIAADMNVISKQDKIDVGLFSDDYLPHLYHVDCFFALAGHISKAHLDLCILGSVAKLVQGRSKIWFSWPLENKTNWTWWCGRRSLPRFTSSMLELEELEDLHVTVQKRGDTVIIPPCTLHMVMSTSNTVLVGAQIIPRNLYRAEQKADMALESIKAGLRLGAQVTTEIQDFKSELSVVDHCVKSGGTVPVAQLIQQLQDRWSGIEEELEASVNAGTL